MLGKMALFYFSKKGYKTLVTDHRFDETNYSQIIKEVIDSKAHFVINCIGKIKQKSEDLSQLIWANAILPLELINKLDPKKQILIQPSTDCVFSGKKQNPYLTEDISDATDDYGWSKRLGEVAVLNKENALLIRVSIIGLDNSIEPKGLLGWFLNNQKGANLNGYQNHFWNGITTYEWCYQVEKLLSSKDSVYGKVIQLGTVEYYSKFEMLDLFKKCFKTDFNIAPVEHIEKIDRRLKPDIISKKLEDQLLQLVAIQEEWNLKSR